MTELTKSHETYDGRTRRYCLAAMRTHDICENLGDDIIDICDQDDVAAFKAWTDTHNFKGWTALLGTASEHDAAEIAEYCLDQGAEISSTVVARIAAERAVKVYVKLLHRDTVGIEQDPDHGNALSTAVEHGSLEMVEYCLQHGADPNLPRFDFVRTLLSEAAAYSTEDIVQSLLAHGASRKDSGALIFAAENRRHDMVELLLKEGFDANEIGIADPCDPRTLEDVGTALHKAVENNDIRVAELLMSKTDLTLRDGKGRTPIQLAEELHAEKLISILKQVEIDRSK